MVGAPILELGFVVPAIPLCKYGEALFLQQQKTVRIINPCTPSRKNCTAEVMSQGQVG